MTDTNTFGVAGLEITARTLSDLRYRMVDIANLSLTFTIDNTSGKRSMMTVIPSKTSGKVTLKHATSSNGTAVSLSEQDFEPKRLMEVLSELADG